MKVVAGERAVHVSMTYRVAWMLEEFLRGSTQSELCRLGRQINGQRTKGLAKGYPKPPLSEPTGGARE